MVSSSAVAVVPTADVGNYGGSPFDAAAPTGSAGSFVFSMARKATAAACSAEGVEEQAVGDGVEEGADGLQGGGIVEDVPGEQRLGDGYFHE